MRRMLEFGWILQRKTLILKGTVVALIAVAALVVFLTGGPANKGVEVPETGDSGQTGQEAAGDGKEGDLIIVDVAGAVRSPDVVELSSGSRVEDAVDAAGGLLVNADVTSINRAAVLSDGEKVYIPFLEEGDGKSGDSGGSGETGLVNLNSADADLLETLPGIGPATAAKIIQYRNENGLFKKTEDLMNVSGIGPVTYAELEPLIGI